MENIIQLTGTAINHHMLNAAKLWDNRWHSSRQRRLGDGAI